VLELFQNQQTAAFGDGRAVGVASNGRTASAVSRCAFPLPAEQDLAHQAHGHDFRFGPAADGQVGIAALDRSERFSDCQVAARVGTGDRMLGLELVMIVT